MREERMWGRAQAEFWRGGNQEVNEIEGGEEEADTTGQMRQGHIRRSGGGGGGGRNGDQGEIKKIRQSSTLITLKGHILITP